MEQANKLNEAVKALGSLQNVLGNIDLSELKVAMKIKKKIATLKEELQKEIDDHELFVFYDIEKPKLEDLLNAGLFDFEEDLFKDALETCAWQGNVRELDMHSVEDVISQVNDLGRVIRQGRREINHLEELLN